MPKKSKNRSKKVDDSELTGFDIKINSFGEMESNLSIDAINTFLNHKKKQELKNQEEE